MSRREARDEDGPYSAVRAVSCDGERRLDVGWSHEAENPDDVGMTIVLDIEYVPVADDGAAGRIAGVLDDSIGGDNNPRILDRDLIADGGHPSDRKVAIGDRAAR